ncbi:MAG: hypothetical protein EPO16_09170 [Dehalococcoidia bacterium]|nr:MAG: hypothetical protein EPO16_09170 [Dehalococcoidia bacterium]
MNLRALDELARGDGDVLAQHRKALGTGYEIATRFLALHVDVVIAAGEVSNKTASVEEQAAALTLGHSCNVFLALLGSALRGEFDAAAYQLRGHFDAVSLAIAVVSDAAAAQKYRDGRLRAGDARERWVRAIREREGEAIANDFDRRMKLLKTRLDDSTHAGQRHVNLAIDRIDGVRNLTLGGRFDAETVVSFVRLALSNEATGLVLIGVAAPKFLPERWVEQVRDAFLQLNAWSNGTN